MDKDVFNEVVSKTRLKIAVSNFNDESVKEKRMNFPKIAATFVLSLTITSGLVFATGSAIEKIWKTPKTYEFTQKLSEEDEKNAISEEDAKKKASDYLKKIGLEKEINNLTLMKDTWENEVIWNIGFENGTMTMDSQGEFKSLNIPSFTYTIPKNYGITREEARVVAHELLSKYNPNNNDDEYELISLKRNGDDKEAYIWYATFYKKYGDLYNKYEKIDIGWIPTINALYSLDIDNCKYENNEQKISKEEAINIAKEKDEKIETRHKIVSADAEIWIDKMNTEVTYREKDIEEYDKGMLMNFNTDENGKMTVKDGAVFYEVEDRVRKVWEVTLYYDYSKYEDNGPERYVYFVDCTTGEIIGGGKWSGAKKQLQDLMADPYNVIEK